MPYILALDQGTTSSRAIVFDARGAMRGVAQREFPQLFPAPGRVEHDPEALWTTQIEVAEQAVRDAGIDVSDVAAIGITNQRETVVLWDRETGRPIGNAIVWQDRRTADVCRRLIDEGHGVLVRERAGLEIDPYFSATKIAWLLDHVDGARDRAERGELAFGTVDAWLLWKLTGGRLHATDASNASRTMLYDIHRGAWADDLLRLFRVPREVLPEVRATSEVYAQVAAGSVLDGVPVASLVGDQQAATMGQVCTEPGMAKNTYGTGCFLVLNTGETPRESKRRLLTTVAWKRDGVTTYALEGSVFVAGAIVQWLRDGLGLVRSAAEIEALASTVEDSDGVVLVPALTGLGAPHWDAYARGTIVGITRGTTGGHLARAALEGIAFQTVDLARAMEQDAGGPLRELRVDGGAAANDLLMQLQADLLQVPVVRPTMLETTALGAAYLAGLATGYWPSIDAIRANAAVDRTFEPRVAADRAEARYARWCEAVERSRGWEPRGDT